MEKKEKTRISLYSICAAVFYGVAIILLIIGSMKDLAIDEGLYDPSSFFGIFFESFAELPMYCVIPLGGTVMFYARRKDTQQNSLVYGIIYGLLVFGGWGIAMIKLCETWFGDGFPTFRSIVMALALTGASFAVGNLFKRKTMLKLRPLAIVGILTVIITVAGGELLKLVWGRARYRDMVNGVNGLTVDDFSFWMIPQGITGNRSFPSGHTYSAAMVFISVSIADRYRRLRKYQPVFFTASALFTFITAFSRLIMGAHFLSDVTIGAVWGFTVCLLVRKFIQPKVFSVFIPKRAEVRKIN